MLEEPGDIVASLIQEMNEWEVWMNEQEDLIDSGQVDFESSDAEGTRRYYRIVERFGIREEACKGIVASDPPSYDPSQEITSIEITGNTAKVFTKYQPAPNRIDPNETVVFDLRLTQDGWRVSGRKTISGGGEIYDLGI